MKQKKIGTTLYVFDTTAYQITEDTDAAVIKIQLECIPAFEVLNESLKDKFEPINYKLFCVKHPEWADYLDDYTVSVSVTGNGAVSASPTSGDEGEEITLTVTPESGYEINTLTAASGGTAITITDNKFTMPAGNVTVTATFQGQEFDITCAEATHGSISAPATARLGDTVTITTTPDTNYKLDTLTVMCGDVPVTVTNNTFTMPAGDVTITATFVQDVIPYEQQYFTIESESESNSISVKPYATGFQYSTDNGSTWLGHISTEPLLISLNTNDKLLIKNTNNTFNVPSSDVYGAIKGSDSYKVYGNIMSLIYGDNFANQTAFPVDTNSNFAYLFKNDSNLTDASNLILPATILNNSCYKYMFYGCTSLTTAPILLATTSAQDCYMSMFAGCTLLDEVIMLLEDIPTSSGSSAPDYLYGWLYGCSATGTAYVSPNLTSDQKESITYSLPGGGETSWTIEDYVPAS